MKQLFCLSLLLVSFFVTSAWAQELTVQRFVLDQEKVYGSTEARKDGTGEQYCALVLVQLPTLQGVSFEGEVVPPIENKGGEYWVYMRAGSNNLHIKHPSVRPLEVKFADYGVGPLQSKATYVLTVNVPQVGKSPASQYVTFTVKPINAGAKVVVNGETRQVDGEGKTRFNLQPGRYVYQVNAGGYSPVQSEFTMSNEEQRIDVTLRALQTQLSVKCQTLGAQVYIDGEYKGIAPWTGTLYPQTYNVEVRKVGNVSQSKTVTLVEGTPQTLNFDAMVPLLGSLDVAYEPEGADIFLDGKLVGQTPLVINNLAVGPHSLELRKVGYASKTVGVTVSEGVSTEVEGCLQVATSTVVSNGHEYVDLGLKDEKGRAICWATCNIGAERPEDCGLYFAWGETVGYEQDSQDGHKFNWANYKLCNGKKSSITKYCDDFRAGANQDGDWRHRLQDNKTQLEPEDDAARVSLGDNWHIPSKKEMEQLHTECKWKWDKKRNGFVVTGKNGNSIFLPAAGTIEVYNESSRLSDVNERGYYWTSSMNERKMLTYDNDPNHACCFYFSASKLFLLKDFERCNGAPIRAVYVSE